MSLMNPSRFIRLATLRPCPRGINPASTHNHLLNSVMRSWSSFGHSSNLPLQPPAVIYSDNHLLVVDKPVGWHSVPNHPSSSSKNFENKCLLTELKRKKLGGGSRKDFLLPLHRIDQPCSGLLLFGKTSKAATRITRLWKKKKVEKDYICVVSGSQLSTLENASSPLIAYKDDDNVENESNCYPWHMLKGEIQIHKNKKQRSVRIRPTNSLSSSHSTRSVSIRWKKLIPTTTFHDHSFDSSHQALLVKTSDGARHVVRALLAQVGGCPIQGDLRYGNNATTTPLPDKSVALHAFRVKFMGKLVLGSLTRDEFVAPIPTTWNKYFGMDNRTILFVIEKSDGR